MLHKREVWTAANAILYTILSYTVNYCTILYHILVHVELLGVLESWKFVAGAEAGEGQKMRARSSGCRDHEFLGTS